MNQELSPIDIAHSIWAAINHMNMKVTIHVHPKNTFAQQDKAIILTKIFSLISPPVIYTDLF